MKEKQSSAPLAVAYLFLFRLRAFTHPVRRSFRILLLIALASILLYGVHRLMNPAPITALGAMAGGLLALVFRPNWRWLGLGGLLGLLAGAVAHACSHIVEGRVASSASLFAHVVTDAPVGLLAAAAILAIIDVVDRLAFPGRSLVRRRGDLGDRPFS
jgi:hypothetical protein